MIDLFDERDASNNEDFTCALAIGISYLKSLTIFDSIILIGAFPSLLLM